MGEENPNFTNLEGHPPEWGADVAEERARRANGSGGDGAVNLDPGSLREIQHTEGPRLLTADEFANDVTPAALVKGLIYAASTTLFTGASKSGKSWFAFQLVLCALAGKPLLGLETQAVAVLLCSLELSAGMVRERMAEIARSVDLPAPKIGENFHILAPTADYVPHLDLSTEAGCQQLGSQIASNCGATNVVTNLSVFEL